MIGQDLPFVPARARLRPRTWVLGIGALFFVAVALLSSGCALLSNAELVTYAAVNAVRTDAGLAPLTPDPVLRDIARFHSQDMAANQRLAHEFDNGCTVLCVMDSLNVPHAWAGENVEVNNWDWSEAPERAVQKWQLGPEHLANMLNCHYTRFGAGVTPGEGGRIYFSVVFEGDAAC